MAHTVIGIFDTQNEAQAAAEALLSTGFNDNMVDISRAGTDNAMANNISSSNNESGVGKFFKSLLGDNDDDVNTYSNVAKQSGAIVTVHAGTAEEAQRAAQILDTHGAIDVDAKAQQYKSIGANTGEGNLSKDGQTISVIEEELQVGKRTVETGGARIRSRIVERPVEESIRLREERVTVSRNPVDRIATEADFKQDTIESIEMAEVPVVSKEARVVEEISLSKKINEREETISDTVRKTEVDVEQLSSDTVKGTPNTIKSKKDSSNKKGQKK